MTSQAGWQTIAINVLPNTSQSKDNLAMKIGQLIKHIKRIVLMQKECRKWVKEISPDLFSFFKKALNEVKACGVQLGFNISGQPSI